MNFVGRVFEHELIHFGAFANGLSTINTPDAIQGNLFGKSFSIERGAAYEMMVYGSTGNPLTPEAGWGIFNYYNMIQHRPSGEGRDAERLRRVSEFLQKKKNDN